MVKISTYRIITSLQYVKMIKVLKKNLLTQIALHQQIKVIPSFLKTNLTAYLLFSTFRSDKYCEWIVNTYVIFCDNDCMMLGNESTRNKINKIKQYYIVVLILHSCLLSMWYVLFITKWDIRKREDFFKFYTVTISYNGTQFSWFCKFLEMFNI